MDSTGLEYGPVAGCFVYSNKLQGFYERLGISWSSEDYQMFKNGLFIGEG
jgi:hypothetical protein